MAQAERRAADPTGERRIIERPRLLKRLEEANARTILLVAPAGYGKTTLAQQCVQGYKGVSWWTATEGARDVTVLSREISEAITSALRELRLSLRRVLANDRQSNTRCTPDCQHAHGSHRRLRTQTAGH